MTVGFCCFWPLSDDFDVFRAAEGEDDAGAFFFSIDLVLCGFLDVVVKEEGGGVCFSIAFPFLSVFSIFFAFFIFSFFFSFFFSLVFFVVGGVDAVGIVELDSVDPDDGLVLEEAGFDADSALVFLFFFFSSSLSSSSFSKLMLLMLILLVVG